MKLTFLSLILVFSFVVGVNAQSLRGLDKSPLDIAYYPDNFAHDRKEGQSALVKVTYSRPARNNRDLFGGLVPYGKVWRTGANEATEIQLYQDATIGGKQVKKGTYALFTIPEKDNWTIILNSDLDYWGAYSYNEKNDVIRVTAKPEPLKKEADNFTIQFSGEGKNKAVMSLAWGNTLVQVPFEFQ
jgi:hypothetical protein